MKKIKDIYNDSPYEIRSKVGIFNVITIVLLFFLFGLMLLRIRDGLEPVTLLTYLLSAALIFLGLFWLRKGCYDRASLLILSVFISQTMIVRLILGYENSTTIVQLGNILLILVLVAVFFINRTVHFIILGFATFGAYVLFLIYLYPQASRNPLGITFYNQMITPSIALLASIVISIGIRRVFDKITGEMKQKLAVLDSQKERNITLISSSASQLQQTRELETAIQKSSDLTATIKSKSHLINANLGSLNEKFKRSSEALELNKEKFLQVSGQFDSQSANVSESSASVEEMVQSIENVAHIVNSKKAAVNNLINTSLQGNEKISQTKKAFEKVINHIDQINDMTVMISSIAAQTNLLSMNAAIEAAHAGESGRGFAVVADEIRKLAASSSENTKQIKMITNELIKSIKESGIIIEETGNAFESIHKGIGEVKNSMDEIEATTRELSEGNSEILKAISNLNNITGELTGNFRDVTESNSSVSSQVKNMAQDTDQILIHMQNINDILSQINDMIGQVNNLSNIVREQTAKLNAAISEGQIGT